MNWLNLFLIVGKIEQKIINNNPDKIISKKL